MHPAALLQPPVMSRYVTQCHAVTHIMHNYKYIYKVFEICTVPVAVDVLQ